MISTSTIGGVRRFSNDGVIQELVAIDGADWHQEGGPTCPTPFPPRRRLESWWQWIEGVDPATAFLASQPGGELPPGPGGAGDGPAAEAPSL